MDLEEHRDVRLNDVFNKISDLLQAEQQGITQPKLLQQSVGQNGVRDDMVSGSCEVALARRLETELRAAKSAQLSCGEVLLPSDLLHRVATQVLSLAEVEPCGLRGCTLYVEFLSSDYTEPRRIATVKWDPNTVSTFELTLVLKEDPRSSASWTNILPQFIKNLTTKGGTIVISHSFDITKKKLYRSYLE